MLRLKNMLFIVLSAIFILPIAFIKDVIMATEKNDPKNEIKDITKNYSLIYHNTGASFSLMAKGSDEKVVEFDKKRKSIL